MGRNGNAPGPGPDRLARRAADQLCRHVRARPGRVPAVPELAAAGRVHHLRDRAVLRLRAAGLAALRRQVPEQDRPFRVPGGDVIPLLAFSANLIVYWAGWNTNWKLFVAIGIGFVLLAVFVATGGMKGMISRVAVQHAVSGVLAQAANFEVAAPKLLEAIGEVLQWQVGTVWLIGPDDNLLRPVASGTRRSSPSRSSCQLPARPHLHAGKGFQVRRGFAASRFGARTFSRKESSGAARRRPRRAYTAPLPFRSAAARNFWA